MPGVRGISGRNYSVGGGHFILTGTMPISIFPDGLEPADPEAVIWRFLDLKKFRDLITTSELYFRRSDLYSKDPNGDQNEGLPPEEYMPYAWFESTRHPRRVAVGSP